jgi:transposase
VQYAERLSDRAAADAVRSRIDWKYALGLELTDPGFHYSVLSQFRDRLIAHGREAALLDVILQRCRKRVCCARAGGCAATRRTWSALFGI